MPIRRARDKGLRASFRNRNERVRSFRFRTDACTPGGGGHAIASVFYPLARGNFSQFENRR